MYTSFISLLPAPVYTLVAVLPEPTTHTIVGFRADIAHNLGYNDRNDGFARSFFSRSKNRFSQIRKMKKSKLPNFRDSIRYIEL